LSNTRQHLALQGFLLSTRQLGSSRLRNLPVRLQAGGAHGWAQGRILLPPTPAAPWAAISAAFCLGPVL